MLGDNFGGVSLNRFATGNAGSAFAQALLNNPTTSLNAYSYLQLPQERTSLKATVSYDFGSVEPYADIYYSKSKVPQVFNGAFMGFPTSYGYTMSIENNPYLSQQAKKDLSEQYQCGLFSSLKKSITMTPIRTVLLIPSDSCSYSACSTIWASGTMIGASVLQLIWNSR